MIGNNSSPGLGAEFRGFGPAGIIAIIVILLTGNILVLNFMIPVGGLLVLVWRNVTNTPWKSIGYVKPKSWILTILIGLISGILLKFILKSLIIPLFIKDPVNHTFHYLVGNNSLLPAATWAMLMAGFGEETVFRGFLFERFGKLFGKTKSSKSLIVIITSVLFALAHYADQGFAVALQALFTGLTFGTVYILTGQIWIVMIMHAAYDLTAVYIIYKDLETWVGHLISR